MRKQLQINTMSRALSRPVVVFDEKLAESSKETNIRDTRLSRQIVSDLEYGIGSRPTLPCCFDDDDFYKSGQVDRMVDIRRSPWDDLADACNPVNITKSSPVENSVETPETPPVETEK